MFDPFIDRSSLIARGAILVLFEFRFVRLFLSIELFTAWKLLLTHSEEMEIDSIYEDKIWWPGTALVSITRLLG